MTSSMPQCRGFTHPLVLLVRSTLRPAGSLKTPARNMAHSPFLFLASPSASHRYLSSSHALSMAAKTTITKTTKTKKTPPTTGKPPTTESLGARLTRASDLTYAQRLAMKATPTTLYEAASQTGFLISSYGAAFFCMGSAAVNSYFNVYNLPPGISPWVPTGFAVIGFVFATLGTVFALRPSSMIKSIKLLPIPSSQLQGTGPIPRTVMLEVAARRISPIPLPLKRFQVRPEQIVLVNRMSNRPVVPSERERMLKQSEDAKRRKEEREYELDHLMTAPFRDAGRASSTIFSNIRRGLTGEGFAPVFIDGVQYKLDADNGYALDDGLVLDRLVRIEPDRQLARSQSEKKE